MRKRLLELLRTHSYRTGRVVLASGQQSDFFIDCKQTVLLAEGHALVGELMFERVAAFPERPVAVAGVELGGCPLASAVALVSWQRDRPLDAVYVRKGSKDHGSQRVLEGTDRLPRGGGVVVLEDVVTTGGSTLRAAEQLREGGLEVQGVVALVDRGEGGAERIRSAGLSLQAIYGRQDFAATEES
jgi:orotate phosphoribosyltransferase